MFTTGKVGQALEFNGASDAFMFPDSFSLSPATFTLMALVKATATPAGDYATILAKSTDAALGGITTGARLLIDSAGRPRFEVGRATGAISIVGPAALPLNQWNFLAATYDGTSVRLFVDGVEVAAAAASGAIANGYWLTAGASLSNQFSLASGTFLSGSIDEPRFQGRAWTAGEIKAVWLAYEHTATYTYDAAGNMITQLSDDGTTTYYRWDAQGRLNRVMVGTSTTAHYQYTSDGERVKATFAQAGGTTLTIDRLFEVRPDSSTVDHIYAGGSPVADVITSSLSVTTTNYFVADHLGSISIVTDNNGATVQTLAYAPFGEVIYSEGTSSNARQYTAQTRDPVIDASFYGARYYFPWMGRFPSADSIVPSAMDPQSLNRYAYVRNNPVIFTDSTGSSWLSDALRNPLSVVSPTHWLALTPSGHQFWNEHRETIVMTGAALMTGGMGGIWANAMFQGMLLGGLQASLEGGNILQGMAIGAITGGISMGISTVAPLPTVGGKGVGSYLANSGIEVGYEAAMGGIRGGLNSLMSGGDFGQGFRAGAEFGAIYGAANVAVFGARTTVGPSEAEIRNAFDKQSAYDKSGVKPLFPRAGTYVNRRWGLAPLINGAFTYGLGENFRSRAFAPGMRVSLTTDQLNDPWEIAHELRHVGQYQKLGFSFFGRYFAGGEGVPYGKGNTSLEPCVYGCE